MIFTAILVYLVFIVQTAFFPYLSIRNATPDLLLIPFLIFLFLDRRPHAQLAAGLGGLLIDIFSPFRFGTYILLYLVVYLIAGNFLRRYLSSGTFVAWVGVVFLSSVITSIPVIAETLSIQTTILRIIYSIAMSLIGYLAVVSVRRKKSIGL